MKVKLKNNVEVMLHADYSSKASFCHKCSGMIYWAKTLSGKFIPLNPGLKESHYDICGKNLTEISKSVK